MVNSILPAPQSAQTVGTYKGSKTSQPTIIINNTKPIRSPKRYAVRNPGRIEIGGGVLPTLKCSRKDLCACVLAVGAISAVVYAAKYGFKNLFSHKEKSSGCDDSRIPEPPCSDRRSAS